MAFDLASSESTGSRRDVCRRRHTQALNGLFLHPADHANSVSQKRIPAEKQQIDAMNRSTTPLISFDGPFDAMDWDVSEGVLNENGLQILNVDECLHDTPCSLLLPGDDYMDTVRQQLSNCWIPRAQVLLFTRPSHTSLSVHRP